MPIVAGRRARKKKGCAAFTAQPFDCRTFGSGGGSHPMPTKSASCSLRHLLQKKFLCGTKGVIVSKDIKYEEAAQAGGATSRVFNSPKRGWPVWASTRFERFWFRLRPGFQK